MDTTLLHDQNGDAIVVHAEQRVRRDVGQRPDPGRHHGRQGHDRLQERTRASNYALNHVALIQPHETFYWVNDQLTGRAKTAKPDQGDVGSRREATVRDRSGGTR